MTNLQTNESKTYKNISDAARAIIAEEIILIVCVLLLVVFVEIMENTLRKYTHLNIFSRVARVKLGELLETPEMDNQQLSYL